jgi:hypothetical protein
MVPKTILPKTTVMYFRDTSFQWGCMDFLRWNSQAMHISAIPKQWIIDKYSSYIMRKLEQTINYLYVKYCIMSYLDK